MTTWLETTEMRWFADGPLPAEVHTWFTLEGTVGRVERRGDDYLLDGRTDVGIKRRSGDLLERKVRTQVGAGASLPEGPAGQLEDWCKQSPADHRPPPDGGVRRAWVAKTITRRRFAPTGEEVVPSDEPPTDGACDIEIIEVGTAGGVAWSLAIAASGDAQGRESVIQAVWTQLLGKAPSPPMAVRSLGWSGGYPAWLAEVHRCDDAARAPLTG